MERSLGEAAIAEEVDAGKAVDADHRHIVQCDPFGQGHNQRRVLIPAGAHDRPGQYDDVLEVVVDDTDDVRIGGNAVIDGPGKGATFTVVLPVAQCPLLASRSAPVVAGDASTRRAPLHNGRLRILLVEDHADTARYTQRLLTAEGHDVRTAGNVCAVLAEMDEHAFDLLLSDLGLPDGSGLDLMRELRSRGHKLSGIALTGFGQETDVRSTQEAGFTAHLTKPIDFHQLELTIAALSRRGPATE